MFGAGVFCSFSRWALETVHFLELRFGTMEDWCDYYDEHSDGFASRRDSEEDSDAQNSDVESFVAPPVPDISTVTPLNAFVADIKVMAAFQTP